VQEFFHTVHHPNRENACVSNTGCLYPQRKEKNL